MGEEERKGESKNPTIVQQGKNKVQVVKSENGIKSTELKSESLDSCKARPYTYRNRNNQARTLVIPPLNMEKLKKVKHLMFYDQCSYSAMSIRLLPQNNGHGSDIPGGRDLESKLVTNENLILKDTHIDHSMVAEVSSQIPSPSIPDCNPISNSAFGEASSSLLGFGNCSAKKRAARNAVRRALHIARAKQQKSRSTLKKD